MSSLRYVYEKVNGLSQQYYEPQRPVYHRLRTYGSTRARSARLPVIITAFFVAGIMFVLFAGTTTSDVSSYNSSQSPPGTLHLVIPASSKDENLCKAILSAAILGYPSPKILNWGKIFNNTSLVSGGSHIAKISGVYSYLESLAPDQDDDLVMMADGYDVWFQLRPQTLLDRYFDINRRANIRIENELTKHVVKKNKIQQKIVFSAQKKCWPWAADEAPCYAVPNSTLPSHIFGADTDTQVNDVNPYLKMRPRFLNSGVAVGTAGAMRVLFAEAVRRATKDANFGSDQNIFGAIFGEQEVYREMLRQRDMSFLDRQNQNTGHGNMDSRASLMREKDLAVARNSTRSMEFGIGLDYESSISLPTVFSEDDTEWVEYNNQAWLDFYNYKRKIKPEENKLLLQTDIAKTAAPLRSNGSDGLPNKKWSEVRLFTDIPTGYTPAIIHHNAHRDGMKNLRSKVWDKIWFQPNARVLMDKYMDTPVETLAIAGGREWMSGDEWKGGARDDVGVWLPYQDMCGGTEDEVFRDGKGAWVADKHA